MAGVGLHLQAPGQDRACSDGHPTSLSLLPLNDPSLFLSSFSLGPFANPSQLWRRPPQLRPISTARPCEYALPVLMPFLTWFHLARACSAERPKSDVWYRSDWTAVTGAYRTILPASLHSRKGRGLGQLRILAARHRARPGLFRTTLIARRNFTILLIL